MTIDQLVIDVLKVYARTNQDKIAYFQECGKTYLYPFLGQSHEGGTEYATECFAILSCRTFQQYLAIHFGNPGAQSIRNVWCVVDMAVSLSALVGYFWDVNEEKDVTGPIDDVWPLLEILAKQSLTALRVDSASPPTGFEAILEFWGVKRILKAEI
jgi:hypothetical protein